jgi:hypothetical protein
VTSRDADAPRAAFFDRALVATAALLVLHVALVAHFTPPGVWGLPLPFLTSAFAIDVYRFERALAALHANGALSAFDPRTLAGQVAGVTEPLGARLVLLLSLAATRAGVSPARAFVAVVLALHAVVPLVGYVAARAYGASRRVACGVLATWSALTFADALTHYAWFSGRIGFVVACALAVATAAFAERAVADRRTPWLVATAVAAALSTLSHPLPAVLVGTVALAALARRHEHAAWRVATLVVVLAPVCAVGWAIATHGARSSEPLATAFRVGPTSLLWDVLEIPGPGYGAAGSSRTMLRVLCLGAGALELVRRRRLGVTGGLALAATAVAYLGALVSVAWPVDPYFFGIAAAFAASLPATALAFAVPWRALVRDGPAGVRVALVVAAAIVFPRAARTVLTYAPEFLPERVVRGPSDYAVSALGGIDEPFPDPLGYDPPPSLALSVLNYQLENNDAARAGVLTDDCAVAAYLALRTSFPVLGPLGERGAPSAAADPTTLLESGHAGDVAPYLARYRPGLVVLAGRPGVLDAPNPLLGPTTLVAGYRVRRVESPSGARNPAN